MILFITEDLNNHLIADIKKYSRHYSHMKFIFFFA
jgi:hypothetical protein